LLEAKISGKEQIAVTNLDNTYDLPLNGAIAKLKSKLETVSDKLKAH
jgi:hypothetical protein